MIREREGEVLHTYRDGVGVWTGGVGHTGRMSPPPIVPGMTITKAMSDAWLESDLGPVEKAIGALVKVPLGENECDALASWLFNVGAGELKGSTILRRINLGDMAGAAAAFDLYHKPASITGRRNGEKAQFLTPDADHATVVSARAKALAGNAAAKSASAAKAVAGATASPIAGAAVAGGLVAASHPTAAVASGVVALLASLVSGFLGWKRQRDAAAMAANASAHIAV